jgi:hypothetical protein
VLELGGQRLVDLPGGRRAGQQLGGLLALGLERAQRAREHRLGDPGQGDAELQRVLGRPAAGALLLGGVEDHIDQRLAGRLVRLGEHPGGDLDQERLELRAVPGLEALGDLRHLQAHAVTQQVVALGDQLHVGVFDAVVNHLHVVPSAVRSHVGAARRPVDLGGDCLEDRLDRLVVGFPVAPGHDARALQRALLAAGHAGAEEVDALLGESGVAPLCVAEVGVAAVDQHIAVVEVWRDLLDHRIGGRTGLHHAHQHARTRERADPPLDRLLPADRALRAMLLEELLGAARGAVVHHDGDVVMGHVARQVGAHRGQSGQAEVRS